MKGLSTACALLALCMADRPWRCAADCDANITKSLKAKHRDPMEFDGVFTSSLYGEYNILLMSSPVGNIAGKTGTRCLRMQFENSWGVKRIMYPGIDDGEFTVNHRMGVITTVGAKDAKGPVKLTHYIAYLTMQVVALYICSDADGDPPLSVVAVSDWYTGRFQMIPGQVEAARQALEKEGIRGFANVPPCY